MSKFPTTEEIKQHLLELVTAKALFTQAAQLESKTFLSRRDKEISDTSRKLELDVTVARNLAATSLSVSSLSLRDLVDQTNPSVRLATFVKLGLLESSGLSFGVNESPKIPWILPLLGLGHIFVSDSSSDSSQHFMQAVVASALQQTEPGQLEVHFYDPFLSGIASPFLNLNNAQENTIHVWNDGKTLDKLLVFLSDYIQAISAEIPGNRTTLPEFRESIGFDSGSFKLVVFRDLKSGISDFQLERLIAISRAGARVGVSLLIGFEAPDDTERFVSAVGDSSSFSRVLRTSQGWQISGIPYFLGVTRAKNESDIMSEVSAISKSLSSFTPGVLRFEDVETLEPHWQESSSRGVTFTVGKSGREPTLIRLGDNLDQKHNVLITGAVGQGKSNLLNVIIHSLSARYSPLELEMLLLDFKEGITLFPLASSEASPSYLPQAKVLGLQSDREFGLSVLQYLDSEFSRRAAIFKPFGDNIEKYREKSGDKDPIPRIVLIIDEFHLLFDPRDDLANEAARLLERVARLGRAYGVHLILASQTISGISALMSRESGLFSQFPIRIALKNSVSESYATLSNQNDAAAKLKRRGEAIVNRNYGLIEDNEQTVVAGADDEMLESLRDKWLKTSQTKWPHPRVFDGSRPATISEMFSQGASLLPDDETVGSGAFVFFGQPLRVEPEPIPVRLTPDSGRNVAIIGAGSVPDPNNANSTVDTAVGSLQAMGLALALQHRAQPANFLIIDCLELEVSQRNNQAAWKLEMQSYGQNVEIISRENGPKVFGSVLEDLASNPAREQTTYIIGFALDRLIGMDQSEGFEDSPSKNLQKVLETGPPQRVHVLGSWSAYEAMSKQVSRSLEYVQLILLLKSSPRTARDLFGSLVSWESPENRGLFGDKSISSLYTVIPFSPLQANENGILKSSRLGGKT